MDSDESGSSASNSSSSSSSEAEKNKMVTVDRDRSPPNLSGSSSGDTSSPSKSDSDSSSSSSSSSDSEDDDAGVPSGGNRKSSSSSSEDESSNMPNAMTVHSNNTQQKEQNVLEHQQSVSPEAAIHASRSNSATRYNQEQDLDVCDNINLSHEDLSDVSDLECDKRDGYSKQQTVEETDDEVKQPIKENNSHSHVNNNDSTDNHSNYDNAKNHTDDEDDDEEEEDDDETDLRHKLVWINHQKDKVNYGEKSNSKECTGSGVFEDIVKTHDEDALDFEAEEGECQEICKEPSPIKEEPSPEIVPDEKKEEKSEGEADNREEELEEGEVTDEDDKRPEETEPKPVCRFYTRGQCTWGMSCRFLHPGVTDKGNYTMFENMVRSLPMPQASVGSRSASSSFPGHSSEYHDYRNDRPSLHHRAAVHHSSSMYSNHHDTRSLISDVPVVVENAWERGLRTAKEMMRQANKRKEQDMDFEDKKMNLTLSPDELEKEPYFIKERVASPSNYNMYSPPDRFSRGPPHMGPYDDVDSYGRSARYRELPPHRMPQYEDGRRIRPTREVIVQRVEPVGRGDEWNDPWMRAKSPGVHSGSVEREDKRRRDRRSYSSNSSYSTSNSSQSDSSSDSSRSPSPEQRRRHGLHKLQTSGRRHGRRSPTSSSRPSRRTPSERLSPSYKRRGHGSPIIDKRSLYSPAHKRKKLSPITKKNEKSKRRRSSSSSGSGSSNSSGSESDSGSSSSDSSSASREATPPKRSRAYENAQNEHNKSTKKVETTKKRSPISIEIKKQATVGASALFSPTNSASSEKEAKKSRREELLKQLRAVEDAIAKKRSKLA